tara:strand:+ start:2168 stop:2929 length:762 start_codon:yes stop_codon:yes gene_type:complete
VRLADHHKLLLSQGAIHLFSVIGLFYMWDASYLWFTLIGIIFFAKLGIEGYCHRYLSHGAFSIARSTQLFLNSCAIFGLQGPPMIWAANHSTHHKYSDVDGDPHPATDGWRTWFWIETQKNSKISSSLIKRLIKDKAHVFIKKYYYLIYWSIVLSTMIINIKLALYLFALPAIYSLHAASWVNVFGHKIGYKNFNTNDNSTNVPLPFLLMHPYHNNHHAKPNSLDISVKWYEIDHIKFLINTIKKIECLGKLK